MTTPPRRRQIQREAQPEGYNCGDSDTTRETADFPTHSRHMAYGRYDDFQYDDAYNDEWYEWDFGDDSYGCDWSDGYGDCHTCNERTERVANSPPPHQARLRSTLSKQRSSWQLTVLAASGTAPKPATVATFAASTKGLLGKSFIMPALMNYGHKHFATEKLLLDPGAESVPGTTPQSAQ